MLETLSVSEPRCLTFFFLLQVLIFLIGPQTFKSSEAPGYHSAYIAMLVGYVVKLAMVVVLYVYMYTANKKRDREAGEVSSEEEKLAIEKGMQDQTELDNKGFRYTL